MNKKHLRYHHGSYISLSVPMIQYLINFNRPYFSLLTQRTFASAVWTLMSARESENCSPERSMVVQAASAGSGRTRHALAR